MRQAAREHEGEDQEAVNKGDGGDGQGLACGGEVQVGGRDNDRVREVKRTTARYRR